MTTSRFTWSPDPNAVDQSRVLAFARSQGLDSVEALQAWAVEDIGRYWDTVVQFLGLEFTTPYRETVDLSAGPAWPEWFVGGHFNYVRAALDRWIEAGHGDRVAVYAESDDGTRREVTFSELQQETYRVAGALRTLGVGHGDRVGILMSMTPETVAVVLALGALGAIFVPMFSGFGPEAVASRLQDAGAKVLVTHDGFYRRGGLIDLKSVADAAIERSPTVEHCLVVHRAGNAVAWNEERDHWLHDLLASSEAIEGPVDTAANDPYMIIYTSGTTGRPKGALHVQSGFPIKAAHDMALCFDVGPDDTVFWVTDLGWMMGPWLVCGGLLLGASIVLFDGTPDYPNPGRLWQMAEWSEATLLGVAPTAVRVLMTQGDHWVNERNLDKVRILGSSGEPWNPGPWQWFVDVVGGGRCPLINYSGGTETSGGIVTALPTSSLKPCGFSGPVPGMDADVLDENGNPVRGSVGELVIRQPWVGITQGFWNDRERYEETYWARFPGIWVHGDWAEVDEDGCWYIRGRSDDTLKVAGKRVGPAEVESAAVVHPAVQEAAAIGVPDEVKGESIVVFAVLRQGVERTDSLNEEIRRKIGKELGSALRPKEVHLVTDLPKTRNAKVMRRVIRAAYLGLPAGDTTALENPRAVDEVVAARAVAKG
jgi:acetyl-CoA synthetase